MIKVAVLGFGVVGSGVAELLTGTGEASKKADELLQLKYILDLRDFSQNPLAPYFVNDFAQIENDPEVSIVIETIGGAGAALDFTRRALEKGKSVVTSNKEVVAKHGKELMDLARDKGASYLFEASVGGGIPILRPLNQCLAANEILEICGILNGTTNYIFTRMIEGKLTFDEALREAQEKGYAERDPSADIEGHDTCRKICILASIAFGWHVKPEQVETRGITQVTLQDVAYADACRMKIKLLGRAIRREDGGLSVYVEPHLVPMLHPLAGVEDVFNAITVKGNATGDVMFYGRGAGKMPTASAVVADAIAIARQLERSAYRAWEPNRPQDTLSADALESRWYVRVASHLKPQAATLEFDPGAEGESAFLTEAMTRGALEEMLKDFTVLSALRLLDERD